MLSTVFRRLASRWTAAEDGQLARRFAEVGPAWTVLALGIPSRSPLEVRRRILALAYGAPPAAPSAAHSAYSSLDIELHGDRLVRIPAERVLPGPASLAAAAVRGTRERRVHRLAGWSRAEMVAVRQAYEEMGPNWRRMAGMLQWRTPAACRNVLFRQWVGCMRGELSESEVGVAGTSGRMGDAGCGDMHAMPQNGAASQQNEDKSATRRFAIPRSVRRWMRPIRPSVPLDGLSIEMRAYAPRGLEPGVLPAGVTQSTGRDGIAHDDTLEHDAH